MKISHNTEYILLSAVSALVGASAGQMLAKQSKGASALQRSLIVAASTAVASGAGLFLGSKALGLDADDSQTVIRAAAIGAAVGSALLALALSYSLRQTKIGANEKLALVSSLSAAGAVGGAIGGPLLAIELSM